MLDFLVVGGGLFGSTIAAALETLAGKSVMIVDDRRPLAGSKPAACLMKPSWFSGMPKEESAQALALLNRLFGVEKIAFRVEPSPLSTPIMWVDPRRILGWGAADHRLDTTVKNLLAMREGGRSWLAECDGGVLGERGQLEARMVVLATGVWASQLRPVPGLEGRAGAAFLWPSRKEPFEPRMLPGSPNPYRQVVAFDRGDGVWAADGMAVKALTDDVIRASRTRCAEFAGLPYRGAEVLTGIRPYMKTAGPAHLEEREPNLWIATGGAKNGTIAAAWCALRLVRHYGG